MTNDNPIPDNTPPEMMNPKDHVIFRHVMALLQLQHAAQDCLRGIEPEHYTPEVKMLADTLANPILTSGKEMHLLAAIEAALTFITPGPDIPLEGFGMAPMRNPEGDRAIGILMNILPGRNVIKVMNRKLAEKFEQSITKLLDEHYGRLIKL